MPWRAVYDGGRLRQGLRRGIDVPLAGTSSLLLFHGSPSSNNCDLVSETSDQDVAQHLGDQLATVMVGGHTHIQMLRQHRGRWLVNPGSVGMPFERFVSGAPPSVLAHRSELLHEVPHFLRHPR